MRQASSSTMRAIVVRELGDYSRLTLDPTRAVPALAAGTNEVLVRNSFAGLNFHDTYTRSGLYPMPLPTDFVVGCEGGGVVAHVPPSLRGVAGAVREGDRVVYLTDGPRGTYAEFTPVAAQRLMPVPDALPLDVATAAAVQGLTAHYLVNDSHALRAEQWCLVHAAAGGTGQWIVRLAKRAGARVIATVGSAAKAAVAEGCGANHVLAAPDISQLASEVRRLTRESESGGPSHELYGMPADGVHAVYDGVGLATWEASLGSLRPRGTAVFFGNASGPPPPIPPLLLSAKGSLSLTRPKLHDFLNSREEVLRRSGEVLGLLAAGELEAPAVQQTLPLTEEGVREGHRLLEGRGTVGKVLFALDGPP